MAPVAPAVALEPVPPAGATIATPTTLTPGVVLARRAGHRARGSSVAAVSGASIIPAVVATFLAAASIAPLSVGRAVFCSR